MSQTSPKPPSHVIAHARQGDNGDWQTHALKLRGKGSGLRDRQCRAGATAHKALQGTRAQTDRRSSPAGGVHMRPECR